jgi:Cof subfamily protein (haloacid dehalogenase superfamily)
VESVIEPRSGASELDLSTTAAVVLDVDGTIAGPDHRVTPRTSRAMAALEHQGVRVVLATGRSRGNVLDICRAAGVRTPAISCNGGVVTDPVTERDLRVRAVPPDDIAAMLALHRRTGKALTWWTARDIFVTSARLRDVLLRFGDPNVHLAPPDAIAPGTVIKMMVFGTAADMDAIAAEVREHVPRAMRSMDEFWELSAPDASKWSAVSFVLERLGVDPAQVAGVGDGGNDVVWMREIASPVAMGNARPEALAVARAVVAHHADDGAADFLEEVLRQLRPTAAGRSTGSGIDQRRRG